MNREAPHIGEVHCNVAVGCGTSANIGRGDDIDGYIKYGFHNAARDAFIQGACEEARPGRFGNVIVVEWNLELALGIFTSLLRLIIGRCDNVEDRIRVDQA